MIIGQLQVTGVTESMFAKSGQYFWVQLRVLSASSLSRPRYVSTGCPLTQSTLARSDPWRMVALLRV